jgi:hypothetical protein
VDGLCCFTVPETTRVSVRKSLFERRFWVGVCVCARFGTTDYCFAARSGDFATTERGRSMGDNQGVIPPRKLGGAPVWQAGGVG